MLQPYKVSKVTPLSDSVLGYLTENEFSEDGAPTSCRTIGGVLSNTNYTWYANGPRFQIVHSKTGVKVAAWTFGSILKDTSTKVTCVDEIPVFNKDLPLLVVGLECLLTGGSICVFDLINSKVLRVIQIKDKVTSVHVVNSGSDVFSTLGPLRAFDGVIAVGTAGGDVLLVDLCQHSIDDARYANSAHEIKDELFACQITILTFKDIDRIENHKQRAAQHGNHLAIHLNAVENNISPHFVLKGPKGEDRVHVNKSEVTVSAIHYTPQLGSVLVGYNFGALQIWNIINMTLIYTSPVYEENIPVSHFAVQEPTDDPRIFCYVWAVYSNTEPYHIGFPVAVLYALNFESKEWHDGYGYLYEGLQSCSVRFQTELSLPHSSLNGVKPQGGYCVRLNSFVKGCTSRSSMLETHDDTLTVCSVMWNIWCSNKSVHSFLSIFDLNQWYKEQMPCLPDPTKYRSYMSYVCISDLIYNATNERILLLDAHINESTISQFIGAQKLEEHYYPSTLAFECCVCSENSIIILYNQGQQRALLTFMDTSGPLILLKPVELFEESIKLGLNPLFTEFPQDINVNFQREHLLGIVLEQQMVGWLCKCVSAWCNGSYTSVGCSLDFFLTWAWNRAVVLKANADKLCIPLFDYSRIKLDSNTQRLLNNSFKQLSNLSTLYEFVCSKLEAFLPNPDIIHQQWNSIHMVSVYLEVLQWLLNVRLLPEYHISSYKEFSQLDSAGAPYPIDCLLEYYNERRTYLHILNKEKFSSNSSLLFIDNLIDFECGGAQLHNHWENDGGNGLYPPQSLQALLLTYLVDGVDLTYKHSVVIYVFLDLAMALDQDRYKVVITHLIKFPAVFKLSPSIIKITQAFWQLDHGDFETAMELLLDAHICSRDLKMWHHRVVLNALLVQEQHNFALLYLQVRRPPLRETEDLYKAISLFVANNMLDEAFYYQRHNSTKDNEIILLRHIFEECNKNHQIKSILYYGLSYKEEEALINYLEEVNYPEIEDFRVIYYMHQSRYLDLFDLQSDSKTPGQLGLVGQKNVSLKDGMVNTLYKFFPQVSKSLISACRHERFTRYLETPRPSPMSVVIHNTKEQAKYKSTLVYAGVRKARETWSDMYGNDRVSNDRAPFLRTPIATPVRSILTVPVTSQKLISPEVSDLDDSGPTPSKRMKLSPRQTFGSTSTLSQSFLTVSCSTHLIRLDTLIVKRKVDTKLDFTRIEEKFNVCTPQSILKVRNLMSQSSQSSADSTPKPVPALGLKTKELLEAAAPSRVLRISPRKSLSRSVVRFEKLNESSSLTGSTDSSVKKSNDISGILSISGTSDKSTRKSLECDTTKNSSQSVEEAFYSPESSLSFTEIKNDSAGKGPENETEDIVPKVTPVTITPTLMPITSPLTPTFILHIGTDEESEDVATKKEVSAVNLRVNISNIDADMAVDEKSELKEERRDAPTIYLDDANRGSTFTLHSSEEDGVKPMFTTSPKSRPSYRGASFSGVQTRSRSRESVERELNSSSKDASPKKKFTPRKSQTLVGKVSGRKSLSRQVLENNAFSSLLSANDSPVITSRTVEKSFTKSEKLTERTSDLNESVTKFSEHQVTRFSSSTQDGEAEKSFMSRSEFNSSSIGSTELDDTFISGTSDVALRVDYESLPSFVLQNSLLSNTSDMLNDSDEVGQLGDNIDVSKVDGGAESSAEIKAGDERVESDGIKLYGNSEASSVSLLVRENNSRDSKEMLKQEATLENDHLTIATSRSAKAERALEKDSTSSIQLDNESSDRALEIIEPDDVLRRKQSSECNDGEASERREKKYDLDDEEKCDAEDVQKCSEEDDVVPVNVYNQLENVENATSIYEDISVVSYGEHNVNILFTEGVSEESDRNEENLDINATENENSEVHGAELNILINSNETFSSKEDSENTEDKSDIEESEMMLNDNVPDKKETSGKAEKIEVIEIDSSEENDTSNSIGENSESDQSGYVSEQNVYCYEENNIFETDVDVSSSSASMDSRHGDDEPADIEAENLQNEDSVIPNPYAEVSSGSASMDSRHGDDKPADLEAEDLQNEDSVILNPYARHSDDEPADIEPENLQNEDSVIKNPCAEVVPLTDVAEDASSGNEISQDTSEGNHQNAQTQSEDADISAVKEFDLNVEPSENAATDLELKVDSTFEASLEELKHSNDAEDNTLDKTDILDTSTAETERLEVTGIDILDHTTVQEEDSIVVVSAQTVQQYVSFLPSVLPEEDGFNKTDILDDCTVASSRLEISAIDILDSTLDDRLQTVYGPDDLDATKTDKVTETKGQSGKSKAHAPRKRVVSFGGAEFITTPKLTRKRSASVDQLPEVGVTICTKEDLKKMQKAAPESETLPEAKSGAPLRAKRRLRSNSNDSESPTLETRQLVPQRRNRRTKSDSSFVPDVSAGDKAELEKPKAIPKKRSRAASVSHLPVIDEEANTSAVGVARKSRDKIELKQDGASSSDQLVEYAASRRLTRHQKQILEKGRDSAEAIKSTPQDGAGLNVPTVSNTSLPSAAKSSLPAERKQTRRNSYESSSSVASTPTSTDGGSPNRKRHARRHSVDSTISDRVLRSGSVVSSPSTKRGRKNSQNEETSAGDDTELEVRRSTRNRSKSQTPEKSDTESVSSRKSVRRHLINSESELPQIPEETADTSAEATNEVPVKKGRKRKVSTRK